MRAEDAPVTCMCRCHRDSIIWFAPDVRDHIAAITACSKCLNLHTVAIVSEWPPPPPANPLLLPPWPDDDATGGTETK